MATHLADVSVLFGAPAEPIPAPGDGNLGAAGAVNADNDVDTFGVVAGRLVRVPNVVLSTESEARADFVAAGLVPGRRDPAPRPVDGRSEVVIRTHPRVGSLVSAGSRVDYEVLPGEPRKRTKPGAYVDHDSASSLEITTGPLAQEAAAADPASDVDYDVVDTLSRLGGRPMETLA